MALVLLGDGATSEGDTHEALNFAGGVAGAGGVPGAEQRLRDQRAAGQADRRAGAGRTRASATACPALLVDGNDAAAVYAAVRDAVDAGRARAAGRR